jgi:hypothetical protein
MIGYWQPEVIRLDSLVSTSKYCIIQVTPQQTAHYYAPEQAKLIVTTSELANGPAAQLYAEFFCFMVPYLNQKKHGCHEKFYTSISLI